MTKTPRSAVVPRTRGPLTAYIDRCMELRLQRGETTELFDYGSVFSQGRRKDD